MTKSNESPRGFIANVKEIQRRVKAHNVVVASAGVAFYGLLAIVPTLIALVSIYGLVTDPNDIADQVDQFAGSLDGSTQELLTDQLESIIGESEADAAEGSDGSVAGTVGRIGGLAIGVLLALFGASGAVQKLIGTVAVAYEAPDSRPGWKQRLMAYGFTTGAIIGVAGIAFILGVLPAILSRVDLGGVESLINVLQLPVLALVFVAGLTILYRYGPDRSPRTPWRNPGAIVATVLFVLFAIALSVYIGQAGGLPPSYGLLGSIAVLMIFLQLTALSVIIGAEVNGAVEGGVLASSDPVAAAAAARTGQTSSAVVPAAVVSRPRASAGEDEDEDGNPIIGFGKAAAGLVLLAVLGRAAGGGD